MTSKEKVLKKYPYAGAQLSAMHGWQIVDYGKDGLGTNLLVRTCSKGETRAWYEAWVKIKRSTTREERE